MLKRCLGVLLACCMLFTLAQPMTLASAADTPSFVVSNETVTLGDTDATVDVTVTMQNNPGVDRVSFNVVFPEELELTAKPVASDILPAMNFRSTLTSPYPVNMGNNASEEVVAPSGVNGKILTLTFKVKADTPAGTYNVELTNQKGRDHDMGEVTFAAVAGGVTVSKEAPSTTVTVTFDGNEGIPTETKVEINKGETVTVPATNPTREGYTFKGWFTDKEATKPFETATTFDAGTTLYAGWDKVTTPEPVNTPSFVVSNETVTLGDTDATVDVTVTMQNNPGVDRVSFNVVFPEELELTAKPVASDILPAMNFRSTLTSPYPVNMGNNASEEVVAPSGVNGKILTLTFKVKADTPAGTYNVELTNQKGRDHDMGEVTFAAVAGGVTVSKEAPSTTVTVTFDGNEGIPTETKVEINKGETVTVPATNPTREGYTFKGWFTDKEATKPFETTTTFDAGTTLYAGWDKVTTPETTTYDVTVTPGTNGEVKPDKDKAAKDETVTLTVTPATGYELDALTVKGASASIEATKASDTTYTFTMPGEAVTVAATFKATTPPDTTKYDVTVTTPTNGTVTPDKDKAAKDETVTLTVTPATGYELDALTVKGASASIEATKASDTTYTFTMPGEAVTVAATFKATTPPDTTKYDVTVTTPTNGTVTPDKAQAAKDETVTLTVAPDKDYKLDALTVKGTSASVETTKVSDTTYTFVMPGEAVTVAATFVADGSGGGGTTPVTEYAITYEKAENGKISGVEKAAADTTVTVTATPDAGYKFSKLTVNGRDITGTSFTMPAEKATVSATFEKVEEYAITYEKAENGKISGVDKAAADADVSVTVEPAEGYKLDKLTVNGEAVSGTTFKMPAGKVTVSATFVEKPAQQGCYIATSVYGSYDAPEVWTLRRFRDDVLGQTWYGRLFIKAYYATSPTLVRLFGDAEWFQNFWREKLDGLVQNLQDDGFESTPYQDKDW